MTASRWRSGSSPAGRSTRSPRPTPGPGNQAEYVAVEGNGKDLSLEVTYDGLTQTLDVGTGKLDKGVAAGLYDLPKTKIKIKDCPTKEWFTTALIYQQYECQYTTAVPSPYVANKWAKKGHTWLSVRVATNLALYATGELDGALASYDVVGNKELSTIDGEKPLDTLNERGQRGRGVRDARLRHHRRAAQDDADPARVQAQPQRSGRQGRRPAEADGEDRRRDRPRLLEAASRISTVSAQASDVGSITV